MGGTSGSLDGVRPDTAGSGDAGRRDCPVGDGGTVRQLWTRLASGRATADGRSAGRIEQAEYRIPQPTAWWISSTIDGPDGPDAWCENCGSFSPAWKRWPNLTLQGQIAELRLA